MSLVHARITGPAGTFVVMSSCEQMPSSCWGEYRHIAVVQLTSHEHEAPAMISYRPKSVKAIPATWRKLSVGTTDRCAFQVALNAAKSTATRLALGL